MLLEVRPAEKLIRAKLSWTTLVRALLSRGNGSLESGFEPVQQELLSGCALLISEVAVWNLFACLFTVVSLWHGT